MADRSRVERGRELVTAALRDFEERARVRVSDVTCYPCDSSHSVFFRAESEQGPLLAKWAYDTVLAGRARPLGQEFAAMRVAHRAGMAPRPLHVDHARSVLVQQELAGATLQVWDEAALDTCIGLAARLMVLDVRGAGIGTAHVRYADDLARSAAVLAEARVSGARGSALRRELLALWPAVAARCERAQRTLAALPLVFSHNDIAPDNVIRLPDGELRVIDFERAALSKGDSIVGQLAVDHAIDTYLREGSAPAFEDVWDLVARQVGAIPEVNRRARTLERLVQNAAYGIRQLTMAEMLRHDAGYAERKGAVAEFCVETLRTGIAEWG